MSDSDDSESFHSADEGDEVDDQSTKDITATLPAIPEPVTKPKSPVTESVTTRKTVDSQPEPKEASPSEKPDKPSKKLSLPLKNSSTDDDSPKLNDVNPKSEAETSKKREKPPKTPEYDPMEGDLPAVPSHETSSITDDRGDGTSKPAETLDEVDQVEKEKSSETRQTSEENLHNSKEEGENPETESGWEVDDWDIDEGELKTPDTGIPPSFPSGERPLGNPPVLQERPASLWGGFNSILGDGISSLTEGISTVLESVETSLGAPTPEELVRMSMEERLALKEAADGVKESWPKDEHDDCDSAEEALSDGSEAGECSSSSFQSDAGRHTSPTPKAESPFGGIFSGVSSVFGTTGKTLVTGSLDVLESIGKKTFDALTETDEKTQRKKFILSKEKPNLSQVLRELKTAGEETAQLQQSPQKSFPFFFEKHQGMISLEALEMLSENCGTQLDDFQTSHKSLLEPTRLLFETNDEAFASSSDEELENFEEEFKEELGKLGLPFGAERLLATEKEQREWLEACEIEQFDGEIKDPKELYERSLESLAEVTARGIEGFLKLGQLYLASPSSNSLTDPLPFFRLTQLLVSDISVLSSKFSSCLNTAAETSENPDNVNGLITELFLEASNSSSYITQAFRLLSPIAQLAAVQAVEKK